MGKRDELRKQADRDFEEIRQAVAQQSTEWLCDALREVPHRKWIAVDDGHIAVGIMAHRAAERLEAMHTAWLHVLNASGNQCENDTSGIGACFRNGRTPDAKYGADRCCWSCLAHSLMER
jgi:pyruvate kinase